MTTTASTTDENTQTLEEAVSYIFHPRVLVMLLLGFSAGVPILLIFSSLSLWLREAGVSRADVTFFSWAALGYSFKFVWAPLVDRLPLPFLGRWLGRRRSWLLVSQLAVIGAIVWMALTDPTAGTHGLTLMALAAVALGFSSATQDIVIDAYRIESGSKRLQALMSSSYIAGYRIGMIVAGAGALYLAQKLGSTADSYSYDAWSKTYMAMAATMLIGVATTLSIAEPSLTSRPQRDYSASDYGRFVALFVCGVLAFVLVFFVSSNLADSLKGYFAEQLANKALASFIVAALRLSAAIGVAFLVGGLLARIGLVEQKMLNETYIDPVRDFFRRYGIATACLLLALIGCYRISDIVLGVISNVFYQDIGFDKTEIAFAVKTFGLLMTIAGGFIGGILAMRFGVMRIMLLGAVLSALTNLLFMLLASAGQNMFLLYVVVAADNLAAGLASAAFIAFLSSLTNISFTAVQYAIFSSLMTLLPKLIGGYSGGIVEVLGYSKFFLLTTALGLPALVLVLLASRSFDARLPEPA